MTEFNKSGGIHITKSYYIDTNNKQYYGFRIKNNYSITGNGYEYWYGNSPSTNSIGITELEFYCIK